MVANSDERKRKGDPPLCVRMTSFQRYGMTIARPLQDDKCLQSQQGNIFRAGRLESWSLD